MAFLNSDHSATWKDFIESCTAFKKVKHWKIVMSPNIHEKLPSPGFELFCRALSRNPPLSLTVVVAPASTEIENYSLLPSDRYHQYLAPDCYPLSIATRPLRSLRSVRTFVIRNSRVGELPLVLRQKAKKRGPWPSHNIIARCPEDTVSAELAAELDTLVSGDSLVELISDIHLNLCKYAQSFERCEAFKKGMLYEYRTASTIREYRDSQQDRSRGQLDYQHLAEARQNALNPFKCTPLHPVEDAIELATIASDEEHLQELKANRKRVLDYLEPQYQRVMKASTSLISFIKEHKRDNLDLFDPNFVSSKCEDRAIFRVACIKGYLLLRECVESFRRDIPFSTKENIALNAHDFKIKYKSLPRDIGIKRLKYLIEQQDFDFDVFIKVFKEVVDDMERQYREIRSARRKLFEFDTLNRRGCDIDEELWRYDGEIDWTVTEPNFSVWGGNPWELDSAALLKDWESREA